MSSLSQQRLYVPQLRYFEVNPSTTIFSQGPEYGVRSIFDHARKHAPCILVLEDLDSMVVPKVRSFFLNELDGLVRTTFSMAQQLF